MNKLDALWEYQQSELALEKVESRIKTTPSRQKLNKLHAFLSEQQSLITNIQKQIEARRTSVDKLAAQLDEFERKYELELSEFQMMEGDEECTAAEMTESRHALEGLLSQVDTARRDLYDTLVWIEKATAEYKETFAKAGKAKKEYDAVRKQCEDEIAAAQPEIEAAKASAAKFRSAVDPLLLKKYDAIKRHHAAPMAKVENNQCGGCNMSLPTATIKRISTGTALVECENCGRILYTV
ncbi:MAG: hypothetical protein E7330_08320 [Clostridiales bacterium]|nr:hypothetical protein [Clostridiales bacterium]